MPKVNTERFNRKQVKRASIDLKKNIKRNKIHAHKKIIALQKSVGLGWGRVGRS